MENDTLICEFTNTVHSSAKPKLLDFLAKQGVHWNVFESAHGPIFEAQPPGTPLLDGEYRTSG